MSKISMVMFDLSGTTVYDDTGVRDCLYKAAQEFNLKTTPEEILPHAVTGRGPLSTPTTPWQPALRPSNMSAGVSPILITS